MTNPTSHQVSHHHLLWRKTTRRPKESRTTLIQRMHYTIKAKIIAMVVDMYLCSICTSKSILLQPSSVGISQVNTSQVNTSQIEYSLYPSLETCDKMAFHLLGSTDFDSELDGVLLEPRTTATLLNTRRDPHTRTQIGENKESSLGDVATVFNNYAGTHSSDEVSDISLECDCRPDLNCQGDAVQLQKWLYEVSNANMTTAERLEKSRWEVKRLERL